MTLTDKLGLSICSWLCPDKCPNEGRVKFTEAEVSILPSSYRDPDSPIWEAYEDAMGLLIIVEIVEGTVLLPGKGSLIEMAAVLKENLSGKWSGWYLRTMLKYRECKPETCLFCCERLDWQEEEKDGWRKCDIGQTLNYFGDPIYQELEEALDNAEACVEEHKLALANSRM